MDSRCGASKARSRGDSADSSRLRWKLDGLGWVTLRLLQAGKSKSHVLPSVRARKSSRTWDDPTLSGPECCSNWHSAGHHAEDRCGSEESAA